MKVDKDQWDFLTRELTSLWEDSGISLPFSTSQLRQSLLSATRHKLTTPAPRTEVPASVSTLTDIRAWLGDCRRCGLCATRKNIVFGEGSAQAKLMFIGEGPGEDEDLQGRPFVGRAGQLLDKIIEAMGLKRDDIYIANVVKCRPPGNRAPLPEEMAQCFPFLKAQIDTLSPKVIVALGGTATTTVLNHTGAMGSLRGRWQTLPWNPQIPVMPTYHPAYLLRNPVAKKNVWEDMKLVLKVLE